MESLVMLRLMEHMESLVSGGTHEESGEAHGTHGESGDAAHGTH